ncbi:ABC-three component system middle component 1 [Escherichia coli]
MLNNFIKQAIEDHQFIKVESTLENISFFKKEKDALRRYIITYRTDKLEDASFINELIINNTPTELLEAPAFAKNTDLIIVFQLDKLSNYKQYEKSIFDIEENAYHFKKYVLYYSNEENQLISGRTLIILEQFSQIMKNSPHIKQIHPDPACITWQLEFSLNYLF